MDDHGHRILAGDTVLLLSSDHKRFLVTLEPGEDFHTHRGIIAHDSLIGLELGSVLEAHTGSEFTVLTPSIEEQLLSIQRSTQIVYPKDIGYILLKLSIHPGVRVIEAGTGSGALTVALARYVHPGGRVYTYERQENTHRLAQKNVRRVGLTGVVEFHLADIEDGFRESGVDAVFLDVREPWEHLAAVATALRPAGHLGCIVPTVNQLLELVKGLAEAPFGDIEIAELMLRQYKPVPGRLRPDDRLTAHTGYLIFARRVGPTLRTPDPDVQPPDAGNDASD